MSSLSLLCPSHCLQAAATASCACGTSGARAPCTSLTSTTHSSSTPSSASSSSRASSSSWRRWRRKWSPSSGRARRVQAGNAAAPVGREKTWPAGPAPAAVLRLTTACFSQSARRATAPPTPTRSQVLLVAHQVPFFKCPSSGAVLDALLMCPPDCCCCRRGAHP